VQGQYKDDANYYNGNKDREECKIWLSRSLKEMDLWKVWYIALREKQRHGGSDENHDGWEALDGPMKLVHFKDEGGAEEDECKEEGCPPSLVRLVLLSVEDNGYFGNKDNDASHHWASLLTPSWLPPLPPAAAAASPSHRFVDVIVDYPGGCNNEWQWHGGDIFLARRCRPRRVLLRPS
jgi:hypothetical protein